MANNPKKLTDPTDEALTAIQQVLSVSDEPTDRRTEAPVIRRRRRRNSTSRPQPYEPTRSTRPPRANRMARPPRRNETCLKTRHRPPTTCSRASRCANDDRQSVGQILHVHAAPPVARALHGRRFSRSPGSPFGMASPSYFGPTCAILTSQGGIRRCSRSPASRCRSCSSTCSRIWSAARRNCA